MTWSIVVLELIVIPNLEPFWPFLVVTKITPLPALEPYNAAALGPLRTVILSTSLGLMSLIPPPVMLLL